MVALGRSARSAVGIARGRRGSGTPRRAAEKCRHAPMRVEPRPLDAATGRPATPGDETPIACAVRDPTSGAAPRDPTDGHATPGTCYGGGTRRHEWRDEGGRAGTGRYRRGSGHATVAERQELEHHPVIGTALAVGDAGRRNSGGAAVGVEHHRMATVGAALTAARGARRSPGASPRCDRAGRPRNTRARLPSRRIATPGCPAPATARRPPPRSRRGTAR